MEASSAHMTDSVRALILLPQQYSATLPFHKRSCNLSLNFPHERYWGAGVFIFSEA